MVSKHLNDSIEGEWRVHSCLQLLCNDVSYFFEKIYPILGSLRAEFCAAGLGPLIGTIILKLVRASLMTVQNNIEGNDSCHKIIAFAKSSFFSLQQAMLGKYPNAYYSAEKVLDLCCIGCSVDDRKAFAKAENMCFTAVEMGLLLSCP